MSEAMFPIQGEYVEASGGATGRVRRPPGEVPWGVAALAYEHYAKLYGRTQSMDRIAERGGFGWTELVALLKGVDHGSFPNVPAASPDYGPKSTGS